MDAGAEVSVASTTSQSTYQTSSKFKSSHHTNLDEPDYDNRYYQAGSDSDSDIDRRSLDLASSHSSDDDYDHNDPSDLKHLSVHDFPQYWVLFLLGWPKFVKSSKSYPLDVLNLKKWFPKNPNIWKSRHAKGKLFGFLAF